MQGLFGARAACDKSREYCKKRQAAAMIASVQQEKEQKRRARDSSGETILPTVVRARYFIPQFRAKKMEQQRYQLLRCGLAVQRVNHRHDVVQHFDLL